MLFRFLCVLWGYGSNHSNQLDIKVGAVLQTQALYVGGALLGIQSTACLKMLAAADSPGESLGAVTAGVGKLFGWWDTVSSKI